MITRTRGGDVEYRMWAGAVLPSRAGYGVAAGVAVTADTVAGVPAVTAAVRFAAHEVASLNLETWRGAGLDARVASGSWQARLFSRRPNPQQTRFDFWATVEESRGYRGNAYIWKIVDAGRVETWWALHPDQVMPQWTRDGDGIEYLVNAGGGYIDPVGAGPKTYRLRGEILHLRGWGDGGALVAPSPLERHRDSLGAAVAKPRFEAAFYANNATGGLSVTFPETVTVEQAREWRDLIAERYEGPENAGKTKIFGGGATVGSIGLTQSDAQYVESVAMTVQEVSRIFGVPVSLLDGERGAEPLSPEHEMQRWLRFGLLPRLSSIESALSGDPDLFGPAARMYPRFDTESVVRGDLATQETIDHQKIQDGRMLVDEWRLPKGMPPLPNGAGMVPQIVPVGGAVNPEPKPAESVAVNSRETVRETVREYSAIDLRPEIHVHQAAQDITLPAPEVHYHAPDVEVVVENVNAYTDVQVDAPVLIESPRRHVELERDGQGRLIGATVQDELGD